MKDSLLLYSELSKIIPWYNQITPPNIFDLDKKNVNNDSSESSKVAKSSKTKKKGGGSAILCF